MLWIGLTLVLIALAALRYGVDSRDGRDRNPFAPPCSAASPALRGPPAPYRRDHTPAADLAALTRAVRAGLHRIAERRTAARTSRATRSA